MIKIIEIPREEMELKYKNFLSQRRYPIKFFCIEKNNVESGLIALEDIGNKSAEISLTIFKEYRHKILFKNSLSYIINFPFSLGYNRVITWTKLKSWVKLLSSFYDEGVKKLDVKLDEDIDKIWFEKIRI